MVQLTRAQQSIRTRSLQATASRMRSDKHCFQPNVRARFSRLLPCEVQIQGAVGPTLPPLAALNNRLPRDRPVSVPLRIGSHRIAG